MAQAAKYRILVVDDDPGIREALEMLLSGEGYEVAQAEDGLSALREMKRALPDVLISDLNMPKMSGFELLSVVRRRFPQVSVVASSGAYAGASVPGGVLADAFYPKGESYDPLLRTVAALIASAEGRASTHTVESAPVWIPRNGKDSHGIPYIVVSCTECLRSFPLTVPDELASASEVRETLCIFCRNQVRFIIDFSLLVTSPQIKPVKAGALALGPQPRSS